MAERKKKRRQRRFNGTGSVYKLSGRRAHPWVARVDVGNDEDGKAIYIYTYHENSTDASNAIPEMQKSYNANPKSEYTVSQVWNAFKAQRWDKLTENTKTMYEASYLHWKPLRDKMIKDIKTSDMQEIINKKSDKSYSLLSKMRSLMVALFNEAAKDDIVTRNYASLLELPKGKPKDTRRAFTDDEIEKIRNANDKVPYADIMLFMCYTGLRPTEMCLLTKDSINIETWTITGGIKTEAGRNRVVPIHTNIRPIVSAWINKGHQRLFTDEQGKPMNKDTWATRFDNARKAIELDDVVPYTTRHTCATLLHAAGADPLTIAKIMGHKDYFITTAPIYTHVSLKEITDAIDKLK